MIAAALFALAAGLPTTGRFDLVCAGEQQEALGEVRQAATPWSGRLSVDLGRAVVRRDGEQENLRLAPGPADRLVVQDDAKAFGDAVVTLRAQVDRATGAYSASSSTEVGDTFRQETTVRAACTVGPFTRLADKDAPVEIPEGAAPAPR